MAGVQVGSSGIRVSSTGIIVAMTGSGCCCGGGGTPNPCVGGGNGCAIMQICDFKWDLFNVNPLDIAEDTTLRDCNDHWAGLWVSPTPDCNWIIADSSGCAGNFVNGIQIDRTLSLMTYNTSTGVMHMELYAEVTGDLIWAGDSLPFGFTLFRLSGAFGGKSMLASLDLICGTNDIAGFDSGGPATVTITLTGTATSLPTMSFVCESSYQAGVYLAANATSQYLSDSSADYYVKLVCDRVGNPQAVFLETNVGGGEAGRSFQQPGCPSVATTQLPVYGTYPPTNDRFRDVTCVVSV